MLEKASIDEAFIDFTRPVREELLKRYPYLAVVPPDAPNGVDSPLPPPPPISWDGLATIVPVNPPKEPPKEQEPPVEGSSESTAEDQKSNVSEPTDDEEVVEEDESLTTWHDVALSIAAELMLRIREDIRTKLGYTTSAVSALESSLVNDAVLTFRRVLHGISSSLRWAFGDCVYSAQDSCSLRTAHCLVQEANESGLSPRYEVVGRHS